MKTNERAGRKQRGIISAGNILGAPAKANSQKLSKSKSEGVSPIKNPINKLSFRDKLSSYKKNPASLAILILTALSAAVALLALLFLIGFVLVNGIPYLTPELFEFEYTSSNASLTHALINTLIVTALSLGISAPLGIFSAIYLNEYAKRGNKLVKLVRLTAETLSGIPSIVYGLFGLLFFVTYSGQGYSLLAGALTLAIMTLPLIMRTAEEALISVPDSYREGSFGLGAGKLRTVFKIVLPSAGSGILAGIILAVGRVVGETAALIYTAGSMTKVPDSLLSSGRTLATHMYLLSCEGLHMGQAYATAVVLLVIVFGINTLSAVVAKKITK